MVATNARYIQYLKKINAHICLYFETGTLLWLFGTTKNREYFAKMYQIKPFNSASQSTIIHKKKCFFKTTGKLLGKWDTFQ